MASRIQGQNSSPVTRPLHGARVSSKALSRSTNAQASQESKRKLSIPSPANPAHGPKASAPKASAHIVSFADAKKANPSSRRLAEHANAQQATNKPSHQADSARPRRMSKPRPEATSKKPSILSKVPFGRKKDKEFQIPSGEDLTTASSNIFRNMDIPSREMSSPVSSRRIIAQEARSSQTIQGDPGRQAKSAKIQKQPSKSFSSKLSQPIRGSEETADTPAKRRSKNPIASFIDNRKEKSGERKRRKNKAKADKRFDKVYGAADAAKSASVQGAGPRAAVYSTKMGSTHKKAAKMQVKDVRDMATQSLGFIGGKIAGFEPPKIPKPISRIAVTFAVFGALGLGLYGPAQQYYIQMRETDRLEAEYAEVAQRTNNLADSIESLHTTEGIEDKAHADLGYVKAGEKSATVKGIATINLLKLPTSNVAPGSIPAPDTWYSGTLDVLFGYSG